MPFLPVYGWVGIWTCFFLSCLAAVEASNVVRYIYSNLCRTFHAIRHFFVVSDRTLVLEHLIYMIAGEFSRM